ncbi:exodeoxyribonuclease VII large subunit, partial [Paeniclostridium sordellii]|uniref:exodeoxyribonuclease VII large subunit n=1 Tax=Paraclostridium sordellii TaxID=1505 RepID=UPI002ED69D1C|nr:exodeoxyribonuclease VII large subunit [Paeniclostridium sordellii]
SGAILHSLSPLSTLDRGYSVAQKDGTIINRLNQVNIDDSIELKLKDGDLNCKVEKINVKEV